MEMKQIRHFSMGHIQVRHHIFIIKQYSSTSMTLKSKFFSFMTAANPNNGNETKSLKSNKIISWDIFKSDIVFHWSQNTEIFQ